MIPKIFHLCWLSGDPYPKKIKFCIDSWKKFNPGYEVMLWDTNRFDVQRTEIELDRLPRAFDGFTILQVSEDIVGPYELHDFFLYNMLRYGFTPAKLYVLARKAAFKGEYDNATLKKWLRSYCKRLFSQQFKRSCLQDGPTLVNFSLSPRTGFLMPSDGSPELYFSAVDELE